ncbi:cilia and flagella associated protein 44 [Phyllostomus discolor]|uniref:Cilia and flagella associated protein 44 n=1 Tax=Phyllostomus discolor TaxID=89673 RepID=A0A834EKY3_9CHIR|nr:cilia and flagella associated protein 44 [Phyllostomus discolor]
MKEPDDHDTDEGKSDRSQSSTRQSLGSSQTISRSVTKEDDKVSEDITDETLTEGEKSYLVDDDSDEEHLEGSSSSFQDDYQESTGESRYMKTPGSATEEAEEEVKKKISETFFYDYIQLVSVPYVTLDSNIPLDLLTLVYPFVPYV